MAIHIQTGKKNLQKLDTKANIQYMPFKIHADCDANVQKYFNVLVKKGDNDKLSSSFRGYPLMGKVVNVPEDYVGIVFHETCRPASQKDERKFFPVHQFDKFVNWNWDKIPSKNDTIRQALDWIDIADALHSPIVEE